VDISIGRGQEGCREDSEFVEKVLGVVTLEDKILEAGDDTVLNGRGSGVILCGTRQSV
jgi:hypothetical protein